MKYNRKVRLVAILILLIWMLSSCGSSEEAYNYEKFETSGIQLDAEICAVKDNYPAMVTVVSDDGVYESGVILNGLAKELDLQVTVAGYVNRMKDHVEEWKEIEKEGHMELISHSWSHLKVNEENNVTEEQLYQEYGEAKIYYEENFTTPSFCFITPNNTTIDAGYDMFEQVGIIAVRQGVRGENSLFPQYGRKPGELLNLMTRGIGDVDTTAGRNEWVDTAINDNTWLIEMWHDVSPNGDQNYQPISTEHAREHLQYMKLRQDAGDIWVAPFTKAVSYIYQRDNCDLAAFAMNEQIALTLEANNADLPWTEFNVPLSVMIELPNNWNAIEVLSGETEDEIPVYVKDSNGTVMVSMYPSETPVVFQKIA